MDAATPILFLAQSIIFLAFVLLPFVLMVAAAVVVYVRFRQTCPPDRLLVVHGKVPGPDPCRIVRGGRVFVQPIVQDVGFVTLERVSFDFAIDDNFTGTEILVSVGGSATVAVPENDHELQMVAAQRLLDADVERIRELAKEIVLGRVRDGIATQRFEQIEADRETFEAKVRDAVAQEVRMLGLELRELKVDRVEGRRVEVT